MAALAVAAVTGLLLAGCGGGSMSKDDVAERVDTACVKLSGYLVWFPEHLKKESLSVREAEPVVDRAGAEFRSTLDSLDPPSELKDPIERLASRSEESPQTPGGLRDQLRQEQGLYEQVGADRCARTAQATLATLDGSAIADAYREVGLSLPPHPDGW